MENRSLLGAVASLFVPPVHMPNADGSSAMADLQENAAQNAAAAAASQSAKVPYTPYRTANSPAAPSAAAATAIRTTTRPPPDSTFKYFAEEIRTTPL
jgi:hypothetical protein